jgi:hypothetical protein
MAGLVPAIRVFTSLMADTNFDIIIIGSGPGGYVTRSAPRSSASRPRSSSAIISAASA